MNDDLNGAQNWATGRLKWDARLVAGGTPSTNETSYWTDYGALDGTPFVAIADMSGRERIDATKKALTIAGMQSRSMPVGDPGTLLLAMYASVGEVSLLGIQATWNQALLGITPDSRRVSTQYLRYVLLAMRPELLRDVRSTTQDNLNAGQIGDIQYPKPPLDEQRAIADYLDQETAQIDALVAKQEELIGLLRERRRATITTAVTKGVNSEPVLTDSGVPSLGSIPAHWLVKKVKHLGRAMIGLTYTPEQLVGPDGGGTLVLRANNIQDGCIDLTDTVYVDGPVPNDLRVRSGDILICARNGSARLIGKNAILESSLAGQTWGAFMAVLRSPFNRYLRWVLNSQVFAANIGLYMTTTVNQLTNATLHNLEVAVPPALEQQQIAAYLDGETSRIDTLIAKAEDHIALAKERRSALITAAVTGQFDVRTARKAG